MAKTTGVKSDSAGLIDIADGKQADETLRRMGNLKLAIGQREAEAKAAIDKIKSQLQGGVKHYQFVIGLLLHGAAMAALKTNMAPAVSGRMPAVDG